MELTAVSVFTALLASVQAVPQWWNQPNQPQEIKTIPPWLLEAEWCCAWVAHDYIGARPNWCQDNQGVSLCCIMPFPWNGGPDKRGGCLNPSFPYRRSLVVYDDIMNPVRDRATCTGYDSGLAWNRNGYGMCIRHGST